MIDADWIKAQAKYHELSERVSLDGERFRSLLALAARTASAEAEVTRLRGHKHPGPHASCTDCGRAMVWQRDTSDGPGLGHYPGSWMCPSCVYDRMQKAESAIASAKGDQP